MIDLQQLSGLAQELLHEPVDEKRARSEHRLIDIARLRYRGHRPEGSAGCVSRREISRHDGGAEIGISASVRERIGTGSGALTIAAACDHDGTGAEAGFGRRHTGDLAHDLARPAKPQHLVTGR